MKLNANSPIFVCAVIVAALGLLLSSCSEQQPAPPAEATKVSEVPAEVSPDSPDTQESTATATSTPTQTATATPTPTPTPTSSPSPTPTPTATPTPDPAVVLQEAERFLQNGDYAGAIKTFRRLVQDLGENELSMDARFGLGKAQYIDGKVQNAVKSFESLVDGSSYVIDHMKSSIG